MAANEVAVNEQAASRRVTVMVGLLGALGMPSAQQNERTALTMLGLLDLGPEAPWSSARAVPRGITELMGFFQRAYGKQYAPNTRETVRRFSMHQLVSAGLGLLNADDPTRPINSPNNRYQVSPEALALFQRVNDPEWDDALTAFRAAQGTLTERYAAERAQTLIPVRLPNGANITLTPGGQNPLIRAIIEDFCPRFTPGAELLYVGDAGAKWAVFDSPALAALGVTINTHGKMPDVVVFDRARAWLVLIEAVTSHGPVNPKRVEELRRLFAGSSAGLVFVTALENRDALRAHLTDISWETEVWLADAPSHLIHFNGSRFLGPYAP